MLLVKWKTEVKIQRETEVGDPVYYSHHLIRRDSPCWRSVRNVIETYLRNWIHGTEVDRTWFEGSELSPGRISTLSREQREDSLAGDLSKNTTQIPRTHFTVLWLGYRWRI